MNLVENIKLLYCLNELGGNKANEVLKDMLHNKDYTKISYEDLENEIKEIEKQEEIKNNKEEQEKAKKEEETRKQLEQQYADEWHILRQHFPHPEKANLFNAIMILSGNILFTHSSIYNLGVIDGKRAERNRRKNKVQAWKRP